MSPPSLRILVGETYIDTESRRLVVVVEEQLDRSLAVPRRTGHFRVVAVENPERGRTWIVPGSALERQDGNATTPRRGGPPRPISWVLLHAVSRVGAAALPHCASDEERDVAAALAEADHMGGDALRLLARIFLAASRRDRRIP